MRGAPVEDDIISGDQVTHGLADVMRADLPSNTYIYIPARSEWISESLSALVVGADAAMLLKFSTKYVLCAIVLKQ